MFALAAVFAAHNGTRLAGILGEFVLLECGLMLAPVLLLYPRTALAGGVSLRAFAAAALEPRMVAVSTRSSLASLPAYLAAGCPIEAVMLLEVIEPLSDIAKTLLNVTGDLSIAAIVTRWSQPSLAGCAAAVEQPAGS